MFSSSSSSADDAITSISLKRRREGPYSQINSLDISQNLASGIVVNGRASNYVITADVLNTMKYCVTTGEQFKDCTLYIDDFNRQLRPRIMLTIAESSSLSTETAIMTVQESLRIKKRKVLNKVARFEDKNIEINDEEFENTIGLENEPTLDISFYDTIYFDYHLTRPKGTYNNKNISTYDPTDGSSFAKFHPSIGDALKLYYRGDKKKLAHIYEVQVVEIVPSIVLTYKNNIPKPKKDPNFGLIGVKILESRHLTEDPSNIKIFQFPKNADNRADKPYFL